MIIRLSSDQVIKYWPSLEKALVAALPLETPLSEEQVLKLQQRCVDGSLQLWLVYQIVQNAEGPAFVVPLAIGATTIINSIATGEKELLIYAVCSYQNVDSDTWQDALEKIRLYAQSLDCIAITALTKVERIRRLIKQAGGDVETTLCRLEV